MNKPQDTEAAETVQTMSAPTAGSSWLVGGTSERRLVRRGWWEEYRCGCISEVVRLKRDLLGYCKHHGEDRRYAHKWMTPRNDKSTDQL